MKKVILLVVILGFLFVSCGHVVWTVEEATKAVILLAFVIVILIAALVVLVLHVKDLLVKFFRKLFKKEKS